MNALTTGDLIPELTPSMLDAMRAKWGRCYAGPATPLPPGHLDDVSKWPVCCVTHDSTWPPKAPLCEWAARLEDVTSDLLRTLYPVIKDQINREWRRRIERLGGTVPRFCDVQGCVEFGAYSHMVAGGTWMDLCRCHALTVDGGFVSSTA